MRRARRKTEAIAAHCQMMRANAAGQGAAKPYPAPACSPHGRYYVKGVDRYFDDEGVAWEFCARNEGPIDTANKARAYRQTAVLREVKRETARKPVAVVTDRMAAIRAAYESYGARDNNEEG